MTELMTPLGEIVENAGLFLENVNVRRAGKRSAVTVTVDLPDGPGGVSSDQLAEVTREISRFLDDSDQAPAGEYVLEVTTPGATRPLHTEREFGRAVGRYVIVHQEGTKYRGLLVKCEGGKITLSIDDETREFEIASLDRARMDVNL